MAAEILKPVPPAGKADRVDELQRVAAATLGEGILTTAEVEGSYAAIAQATRRVLNRQVVKPSVGKPPVP